MPTIAKSHLNDTWQPWSLKSTLWRLVGLVDVTLACKEANSKLIEIITVADVSDENGVGNSSLQIWKLKFGYKA